MTTIDRATVRDVGVTDLVRALPGVLPDVATMLRGGLDLVSLRASTRDSVGNAFQRRAAKHPERPFLRFGTTVWTYGQANAQVNRYASVLAERGVREGSVVGILATNRPETMLVALAAVKLGAVAGMLNYRQRGEVLTHSLGLLSGTALVVGRECAEALDSVADPHRCGTVLGLADAHGPLDGHPDLTELAMGADDRNPPQCARITAKAKAFYIFTSGTSGMPKASTMSHLRWLKAMAGFGKLGVRLRSDDTLYCCLPLYHNNAITVSLASVLAAGATFAIGESFSASRFWDDIARNEATAFSYIGDLCRYLINQPEREADRAHRVRVIVGNGLSPEIWADFKNRFGIEHVSEFYGASECNLIFVNALNLDFTAGTCPLPYAVVDYDPATERPRRDERGRLRKVKSGETGLLLTKVTKRMPFDGYTDRAATEKKLVRDAFRRDDVWFNTGDLVRAQGARHVAFVDRLGDTFRWKGENVATTEVEAALGAEEDIEQAVVYGVEIPGASGKAGMAALRMRAGTTVDGAALASRLGERLPNYAVPLFVRLVDSVAETTTFKVRKNVLRDQGYDTTQVGDELLVHSGGESGYVPFYPDYPGEVAEGKIRV